MADDQPTRKAGSRLCRPLPAFFSGITIAALTWACGSVSDNPTAPSGTPNPPASWTEMSTAVAPGPVAEPAAIWTGSQMIAWGDYWPTGFGGMFDPVANGWTRWLSTLDAPGARFFPTVVWASSRMIVWGGVSYEWEASPIGGVYDPATDRWTPTSSVGAPEGRWCHSAVSTGSKLIVWGGAPARFGRYLDTGGIYDPVSNTWVPTSMNGAPAASAWNIAVWTGSTMIVWGGNLDSTGGVFDPSKNAWRSMNTVGAPSPKGGMVAVWTGSKMIVWGGAEGPDNVLTDTGAMYDPASDSWTTMSRVGAPSPRAHATGVWAGKRMVVWGGYDHSHAQTGLNSGGIYDPARDSWSEVVSVGAPSPRLNHSAVWTGSRMVVWGGDSQGVNLSTGGIYYDPTLLQ